MVRINRVKYGYIRSVGVVESFPGPLVNIKSYMCTCALSYLFAYTRKYEEKCDENRAEQDENGY